MIRVHMRRTVRPAPYESLEFAVDADSDSGVSLPDDTPQIAANKLRYFVFKQVTLFEVQTGVRDARGARVALAEFKAQLRLAAGDVDEIAPNVIRPLEAVSA